MITFSISLPVYKQAEFITTALESLRCQTTPFELAVLDATPDDSVQTILKNYQSLITYQYHHADKGQSAAIQEGWNNTKGEIVAWLNADDYYFPDTLAKVAEIFQTHPEIDVVYGHSVYVNATGVFEEYFPAISADLRLLPRTNIICQPSCFVRRRAMERVGGVNPQLHYIMDWDLWIRLYKAGCQFFFLEKALSVVRIYPMTKTLSGSKKRFKEIMTLLRENTNTYHRMIAWFGFYYDEYKHHKIQHSTSITTNFIYTLLSLLRYLRARFRKVTTAAINGIACKINRVDNECEIVLPWYQLNPPSLIKLTTDKETDFFVFYAGEKIKLARSTNNDKNNAHYQYLAPLPSTQNNSLSFVFHATHNPWHLLSVEIL